MGISIMTLASLASAAITTMVAFGELPAAVVGTKPEERLILVNCPVIRQVQAFLWVKHALRADLSLAWTARKSEVDEPVAIFDL